MSIESKVKAQEGKFAVYVWDPYPRREMKDPRIVDDGLGERTAKAYAKRMNEKWFKENKRRTGMTPEQVVLASLDGRNRVIEKEYFVVDSQGIRIY